MNLSTSTGTRALGFRVEPEAFNWALVEGTPEQPILVAADKVTAPSSYSEPQALSWYRDRVRYLIEQYHPTVAAVRYAETFGASGGSAARKRCRIEGIVVEAANSKAVAVKAGALATISSGLGTKSAKKYLSQSEFRRLDWSKHGKNAREAILVATAALRSS
jgi:Holliday junction resolvasome RuvABC endonuclease subunit